MRITARVSTVDSNDNFRWMTSTRTFAFVGRARIHEWNRVSVSVLRIRQPDRIAGRVSNRIKKSNVPVPRLNFIIVFSSEPVKRLHYSIRWIEIAFCNFGATFNARNLDTNSRDKFKRLRKIARGVSGVICFCETCRIYFEIYIFHRSLRNISKKSEIFLR